MLFDAQLTLVVEEDPERGVGIEGVTKSGHTFKAGASSGDPKLPNRAFDSITQELKGMSAEELTEAGERYQQLREARDLEEILFS